MLNIREALNPLNVRMFRGVLIFKCSYCYRDDTSVSLSWYVNTNEDVADFRVELTKVGTGFISWI